MKTIVMIVFFILFLFSLFGMFIGGNIVHELSHKNDFKNIAYDDEVCVLEFGSDAVASYSFYSNNDTEFDRISKHTEIKAYSMSSLVYLIYFICLFVILSFLYDVHKQQKIEEEIGKQY